MTLQRTGTDPDVWHNSLEEQVTEAPVAVAAPPVPLPSQPAPLTIRPGTGRARTGTKDSTRSRQPRETHGKWPVLTGKEEHYLKRELISQQVHFEIAELNSPTALQRFGAPFRSPLGEVAPVDSELPILRYIFVNHIRNFPFLDQAREKDFWQDRLQVFLESFANKHISSSEDRAEETKRRKLAQKATKLVELMINSGVTTSSGYEERVTFKEIEVVERGADENGLLMNVPEGNVLNGWDVNVVAVRQTSIKRNIRYHTHAEFLIRSKREGHPDVIVGRRYGEFSKLHQDLRAELPGKVLPSLPRKVKESLEAVTSQFEGYEENDADSISSESSSSGGSADLKGRNSIERRSANVILYRENQRILFRAFLRALLVDKQIAASNALTRFLTTDPVTLNAEEMLDVKRRREMDELRVQEQQKFYEVARQRARELDRYMEGFRRDIVENHGLTNLFAEIRKADRLQDLSENYRKFAEWMRIEVAATIYHIFLAEDNSPELFTQLKRIHSLIPYTVLKNIIRLTNPAAVMSSVLDLFLARPLGSRSLMERVLTLALQDGMRQLQKTIDTLEAKIADPFFTNRIKAFVNADEPIKQHIRLEAEQTQVDLLVAIVQNEELGPPPEPKQIEKIFNAYVAWNCAVENESALNQSETTVLTAEQVDEELKSGVHFFSYLKQYIKLVTRMRDKDMMQKTISEPVTLQLFRDLFTIFYDPLVRVYKSANVYGSITDFSNFMDDMIAVIEKIQKQNLTHDPNQTVQAFIDLCARHEDNFYKFVHEVHIHDNGLFDKLMGWLEGILDFLRTGPAGGGKLDMNALFFEAVDAGTVDYNKVREEVHSLIEWHKAKKRWHEGKTRQKMGGNGWQDAQPENVFKASDFGIGDGDLEDLNASDESDYDDEEEDNDDPIEAERKRRSIHKEHLRARAGLPEKPVISEIAKLNAQFLPRLRRVLAG
ncbi:hypothetical protein BJ508DRAFT_212411 [Ascobolus immersus RN42]|uniref:PX domain-containing protein n=1 Tax=Ascobolus immersus RN42 TaxID=1160509 RepID=A0A3N4HXX2_ASCIM|nr:hypothetical protein BJ508DRAFT_212411 [Ascobolus immersus RN42]